jgi:hypothetical protein
MGKEPKKRANQAAGLAKAVERHGVSATEAYEYFVEIPHILREVVRGVHQVATDEDLRELLRERSSAARAKRQVARSRQPSTEAKAVEWLSSARETFTRHPELVPAREQAADVSPEVKAMVDGCVDEVRQVIASALRDAFGSKGADPQTVDAYVDAFKIHGYELGEASRGAKARNLGLSLLDADPESRACVLRVYGRQSVDLSHMIRPRQPFGRPDGIPLLTMDRIVCERARAIAPGARAGDVAVVAMSHRQNPEQAVREHAERSLMLRRRLPDIHPSVAFRLTRREPEVVDVVVGGGKLTEEQSAVITEAEQMSTTLPTYRSLANELVPEPPESPASRDGAETPSPPSAPTEAKTPPVVTPSGATPARPTTTHSPAAPPRPTHPPTNAAPTNAAPTKAPSAGRARKSGGATKQATEAKGVDDPSSRTMPLSNPTRASFTRRRRRNPMKDDRQGMQMLPTKGDGSGERNDQRGRGTAGHANAQADPPSLIPLSDLPKETQQAMQPIIEALMKNLPEEQSAGKDTQGESGLPGAFDGP